MKNRGKYVKYKEKLYEGHGEKGERTVRKKRLKTIGLSLLLWEGGAVSS